MNKQTTRLLEQHFDTAFAAPDGIKKLRELILTLAMQGRLVPQDPNDPPASELLKEIEAEKRRLVKEGKIKTPKALPEIKAEEVPYELPEGWVWVRLHDVFDVRDGTHDTPKYIEEGYPLITSKNLYTGKLSFDDVKFISEADHKKICERSAVAVGDILFAMIGSIGNPVIVDSNVDFSIKNVALFKFYVDRKPDNRFFYYFLSLSQNKMKAISSGAVQSFVSLGFLRSYVFPLPPLPEQHRIVAKIDQLMARCDELETLRAEHEQKRLAVHTSAITRLLDAQEKNSFDEAWQFITRHFDPLYSVKENVTELRKTILQLAVMGKLVPQDPNDPPARELLKEIEAEKLRLVKEGKIKKSKPLMEIKPEEIPYSVPDGWKWERLGIICKMVSDGFHHTPIKLAKGVKYISATHIYNGKIDWNSEIYVSEQDYSDLYKKTKQGFGDILIVNRGAGCGDAAIVNTNERFCFQNAAIIGFNQIFLDGQYILYFLHSSRSHFLEKFIQGGAQPMLSNKLLSTHILAIPPLPEQHRIVAKIEQLMTLCDSLEQQIDATTGKQTELLNALMAQV